MLDFSKMDVNVKVGGSIVDGGGYSLEERVRKMERDLWELKDNRVKSSEDCERLTQYEREKARVVHREAEKEQRERQQLAELLAKYGESKWL